MGEIRRFYQPVDFNDLVTKGGVAIPTISSADTLTNKILTSPTVNSPTMTAPVVTDSVDCKALAADFTAASGGTGATLTSLTGMSWSVAAGGTYVFEFEGPVSMTTNGGLSMALKLTTATLTSAAIEAMQFTASAVAVAANFTTATDQAKFIDQKTTAYTYVRVTGTLVVNAAGSVALQAAQNTSHVDTTTVYAGFRARLRRVA